MTIVRAMLSGNYAEHVKGVWVSGKVKMLMLSFQGETEVSQEERRRKLKSGLESRDGGFGCVGRKEALPEIWLEGRLPTGTCEEPR